MKDMMVYTADTAPIIEGFLSYSLTWEQADLLLTAFVILLAFGGAFSGVFSYFFGHFVPKQIHLTDSMTDPKRASCPRCKILTSTQSTHIKGMENYEIK